MAFLKKILTPNPIYLFLPVLIENWYPRLVSIQLSGAMASLLFFGFFLPSSSNSWRKPTYIILAIIANEIFWLGLFYKFLTQGEVNILLKWIFWIAVILFFGLIFSDKPLKKKKVSEDRQFKS